METFSCRLCSSTDIYHFQCGHMCCNSCLFNLNQIPSQCELCSILPVSHEEFGVIGHRRTCADCKNNFDSDAEYEQHKKKTACGLFIYGCTEQIDDCSIDKHLCHREHRRAVRFCLNLYLSSGSSPINQHVMKSLTEICSKIDKKIIDTIEDDDSTTFDALLVTDFGAVSIIHQIERTDHCLLDNQQIRDSLNEQLIYDQQITNLITTQMQLLEIEQPQQQNNASLSGNETMVSTTSNQIQICHLCQNEYDTSIKHVCQTSINELKTQVKKLSSEIKHLQEFNTNLIDQNQYLTRAKDMVDMQLSNLPVSTDGTLIWNINIAENLRQPYLCRDTPVISPRFSSLTGNHVLNARMYLYGDSYAYPDYVSVHLLLTSAGNKNLSLPITLCLVDQTNNHQHIIRSNNVDLNPSTVGVILRFSQFVRINDIHKQGSPYVNDDISYLIVKLHENESSQYNHYPTFVQNALRQINL